MAGAGRGQSNRIVGTEDRSGLSVRRNGTPMRNPVVFGSVLAGSVLSLLLVLTYSRARPAVRPVVRAPAPNAYISAPSSGEATLVAPPVEERPVDGPPVSLTASDGSGLALADMHASAVIEGPLAFTEVRLAFDNTESRVREGTFKIALPQGATLSRFAMKIGDAWQEGEVVPKEQARRTYEDFLHRKQDPALMERGAGNEFTARVFPIPPRGRKEIVVSYAQELASGAPYALPLRGLPELGVLDVSVVEAGTPPEQMHREHFVPTVDYVHQGAVARAPRAVRSGNLVVARVRPVSEALPDPVRGAVVLVDTSASRALGLSGELLRVRAMIQGLGARRGEALPVVVAAFDQEVVPIFQGDAKDFGDAEVAKIATRRALGASDFEHALTWAREQTKRAGATRVILVTDGVATAGEDDAAKLAAVAASLKEGLAERLDIVTVGGLRDDALARKLVTAGLAHDGVVVSANDGVATLVRRLQAGTRSNVALAVEGATWSYPTKVDGVQPGDEVLVYAELPEGAPLRVRVGDRDLSPIEAAAADRPLVERAWAQAKIASLEADERDHGKSPDVERQIVDLSMRHRVLSSYTGLLVLETDADYARFRIDRRALSDVLTIVDGRLAWMKRGAVVRGAGHSSIPDNGVSRKQEQDEARAMASSSVNAPPPAEPTVAEAAKEAQSFGMLGLSGVGAGSGGLATGGDGAHGTSAPGQEESGASMPRRSTASRPAPVAPAQAPWANDATPMATAAPPALARQRDQEESPEEPRVDPYSGKFKQVKVRLGRRDAPGAFALADAWHQAEPGNLLALTALGESAEAIGDASTAARAYGSIVDLFPARADLRRFAGERLEHVEGASALALAIDTFDKARRDRPDHPASHRLAAFARVRQGDYAGAFDVLLAGLARRYPEGRFRGVDRILREDLGLIAAAWMKAEPGRASEILARLKSAGGTVEDRPSLRFVLNWETDANDVDFHIRDARGGHAFYASPQLPSGGELYADVTTGYGPECFTIRLPRPSRAGPYALSAHYYSRGPMGYGMGKLEIVDHDGHGGLKFEQRPFVVMADHAFVDLGRY